MAPKYKLASLRDFTGGLNLRADQFQLALNESPDLMNVDVDPRGGVRQRGGTSVFGTQSVQSGGVATLIASKVDTTVTNTFATGVCQPGANSLVLVAVFNNGNTAVTDEPTGITGNGLTYTKIKTVTFSGTTSTLTIWRAQGAAPTNTAVTVTYGSNRSAVIVQVVEVTGAKIGNNGADAIIQNVSTNFGDVNVASPQTNTLATFGGIDNYTIGFFANLSTGGDTVGAGFASVSQLNTGTRTLLTEFKSSNDTTVDLTYSGGAQRVMSVALELAPTAEASVTGAWTFNTSGGTAQAMVSLGSSGRVMYGTGSAWTQAYIDQANAALPKCAATMNDVCYIQDGTAGAHKWTGSVNTILGTTFVDNLAAPTAGNMPKAKLITEHNGYMWLAYTNEAATSYPSRVRFSHPNRAEDYRTNDYIDIDIGHDGDYITALVSDGDRLLVFKQRSVHAVYGFDADSFYVQPISMSVGAQSQYSTCRTPAGVFFWNVDGVNVAYGNKVDYMFDRLKPAVDARTISATASVYMGWLNRRLWVSVLYGSARRYFVFDPTVGKRGAWTLFDYTGTFVLPFVDSTGTTPLVLNTSDWFAQVDRSGVAFDNYTSTTTAHISSYYRTAWIDGGLPGIKKRWSRTRTVVLANASITLTLGMYADYNASLRRTASISVTGQGSGGVWGTGLWGTALWGTSTDSFDIEKNVGAGMATAVQYLISGPTTNTAWGIDALIATYRIRSLR